MKNIKNQRGYALLIVLLTIIIFLSLSAAFMSASINHSTQEQALDKNNQAVVAAEMGLKKISTDINNQIELKYSQILSRGETFNIEKEKCIQADKKNCNAIKLKKSLEDYEKEIVEFEDVFLKDLLIDVSGTHFTSKLDLFEEKINIISTPNNDLGYKMSQIPIITSDGDFLKLKFSVIGFYGKIESSKNYRLDAEIKFEDPKTLSNVIAKNPIILKSVLVNESVPIFHENVNTLCQSYLQTFNSSHKKPFSCKMNNGYSLASFKKDVEAKGLITSDFNVFIDNWSDIGVAQKGIKDLFNLNLYVDSSLDLGNINNLKNFKLFIAGKLDAGNANNIGKHSEGHNTMVLQELDVSKFNGQGIIDTTVVLLGLKDSNSSVFNVDKKFKLESSSKFCINLNRFPPSAVDLLLKIDGEGKIYYYGTKSSLLDEPKYNHVPEYGKFLSDCGITNYAVEGESLNVPSKLINTSAVTINGVTYNP